MYLAFVVTLTTVFGICYCLCGCSENYYCATTRKTAVSFVARTTQLDSRFLYDDRKIHARSCRCLRRRRRFLLPLLSSNSLSRSNITGSKEEKTIVSSRIDFCAMTDSSSTPYMGTTVDGGNYDNVSFCSTSAQEWMKYDPNPTTVQYVQTLIDKKDYKQLQKLFPKNTSTNKERIAFGTAGLRGKMLPGPLYMNDLVVIQTAQGIASYCKTLLDENCNDDSCEVIATTRATTKRQRSNDNQVSGDKKLGIVIGYDHRTIASSYHLSSLQFALYTTLVFQQAGFFHDIFLLDGCVATPMVPFVLGQYSSHTKSDMKSLSSNDNTNIMMIGIMVTASHNPKEDAGYKIYWYDGCQIRSPIDKHISMHIEQNLIPWTDYAKLVTNCRENAYANDPCYGLSNPERTKINTIPAYYDALVRSGLISGQVSKWRNDIILAKPPTFCYTAMHGVGYTFAKRILSTVGITNFFSVPGQQEMDPNFPTVQFPNPEEKGALDMAKAYAVLNHCDIIVANDPDADRLAVAERDRTTGTWTEFTGDQIGAMLGLWLWQHHDVTKHPNTIAAMCASTVSSRLLAEIARVEGFYYEDTLTGFKWIGSRAAELHQSPVKDDPSTSYRTIFCYEEAIGFCCGNVIFDKDGISALGVFAELCYATYQQNINLSQHMQSIYDTYGEFVSNNGYYFVSDPSIAIFILDNMTNHGRFDTLDMVGPYKVASVLYLGVPGYDSSQPDHHPTLPCSESSPMITIRFENGCIAQFRGSGTEPKFKYYIELQGRPGKSRIEVADELSSMSSIILQELLQPEINGLKRKKI